MKKPVAVVDIAGQKFGLLTVIRFARMDGKKSVWLCRCECGNRKEFHKSDLPKVKSCGCWRKKIAEQMGKGNARHGQTHTVEYHAWHAMKQRCTLPTTPSFKHYGAKGVSVCKEWFDSFEAFFRDVGLRPSARHSLDRINTNGNYEPGNVRWAEHKVQQRNRRKHRMLQYRGKEMCLTAWAERFGLTIRQLDGRLHSGWPLGLALTAPRGHRRRRRRK